MNQTTIVLIPKGDSQSSFKDFRPISLCNVSYKIISKVLTNRLQGIMPDLITPSQSAFAKGRSITDNILLAHEVLRYIRRHKKGKFFCAGIKIDLLKAYDKVSWHFLQTLLTEMGFPTHWTQLIMQCVTTVSFRVQVNGATSPSFRPKAGLRQGDPLSPYLFILCMNVLSGLLVKAQNQGSLKGIKVARNAPPINHLIYADDILLFTRADLDTIQHFKKTFDGFGRISGLCINPMKSEITFSPNTPNRFKKMMSRAAAFKCVEKFPKYLGSFVDEEPRSRKIFDVVFDQLQSKLEGWKTKFLSQAARIVLIKAVLTSMPLYHLSYFKLTEKEANKCDSILNNFFWGNHTGGKSPHMKA